MGHILDHVHWFLRERRYQHGDATLDRQIVCEVADDLDRAIDLLKGDEKPEHILDELCKLFNIRKRRQ